ncbi:MAG: hypothetical protein FWH18_12220 [Marinilabiliaceae bacterium]|nr:hypothetical protein [Marinilabiliaceae bacterium]
MKVTIKLSVLACLFAGLIFMGCSDSGGGGTNTGGSGGLGDDNTITAKVENSGDYDDIDEVWAVVYYDDGYNYYGESVADAKYSNGGFTIKLPSTVDEDLLEEIGEDDDLDISDPSAKGCNMDLEARDDNGKWIEDFVRYYVSGNDYSGKIIIAEYFYADKAVTIKGSDSWEEDNGKYEETINLSFKKGWNESFFVVDVSYNQNTDVLTVKYLLTTAKQSGLKWYLGYPDEEEEEWKSITTSAEKGLSFDKLMNSSRLISKFRK